MFNEREILRWNILFTLSELALAVADTVKTPTLHYANFLYMDNLSLHFYAAAILTIACVIICDYKIIYTED